MRNQNEFHKQESNFCATIPKLLKDFEKFKEIWKYPKLIE